jgi:tetratricopeptide (TPR) repeat protein
LRIELVGGRQQSFPADSVLSIETQYSRSQTDADALFAQGQFDQALALYRQALEDEPRRWVRRQIVARLVWCCRGLGQPDQAGEAFLLLIRDDPQTNYFDSIPLEWMPRQPSVATEQAARRWLESQQPAAVLLGASHLMTTSARLDALAKLRELAAGADRQVAQLALAQSWRAAVASAKEQEIDAWDRAIEQIPERLAAGPYFVLGLARSNRQQWEEAALALMRAAILYPQQRALSAQSLLHAGRALEELGRAREALRLYRELIRDYPEQPRPVAEAQDRMEAMGKSQTMNDQRTRKSFSGRRHGDPKTRRLPCAESRFG